VDREALRWVKYEHPDWRAVLDSEEFWLWHAEQPESVQALARSPHGPHAVALLNAFKLDTSPRITVHLPSSGVLH
jgi:hypothetical protein